MNKTSLITSLIAAATLAIALTGCSREPAAERNGQEETAGTGSDAMAPAPVAQETRIPQALQGLWGIVPADCTSTHGDAKGLLTIDAGKLEFYESVATLGPIREIDPHSISASFEFTGEGQTWVQEVALSTADGGKTLVRQDTGPQASPDPLTYTRCP